MGKSVARAFHIDRKIVEYDIRSRRLSERNPACPQARHSTEHLHVYIH